MKNDFQRLGVVLVLLFLLTSAVVTQAGGDLSLFPEPPTPEVLPFLEETLAYWLNAPEPHGAVSTHGITISCLDASFRPSRSFDGGIVIYNDGSVVPHTELEERTHLSLNDLHGLREAGGFRRMVNSNENGDFVGVFFSVNRNRAFFSLEAKSDNVEFGASWSCWNVTLEELLRQPLPRDILFPPAPAVRGEFGIALDDQAIIAECYGGLSQFRDATMDSDSLLARLLGGGVLFEFDDEFVGTYIFGSGDQPLVIGGVTYLLHQPDPAVDLVEVYDGVVGSVVIATIDCSSIEDLPIPRLEITVGSANVRVGPSTNCPVTIAVPFGTILTPLMAVLDEGQIWYLVDLSELGILGLLSPDLAAEAGFAFMSDQVAAVSNFDEEPVEFDDWAFSGVPRFCGATTTTPADPNPNPGGDPGGGGQPGGGDKPPEGGGTTR